MTESSVQSIAQPATHVNPLRFTPEGGKLYLAESLFLRYNGLIYCPRCPPHSTRLGFSKDQAGREAGGLPHRYWRCKRSNRPKEQAGCRPEKVSCTEYIDIARSCLSPDKFNSAVEAVCSNVDPFGHDHAGLRRYMSTTDTQPPLNLGQPTDTHPPPDSPGTRPWTCLPFHDLEPKTDPDLEPKTDWTKTDYNHPILPTPLCNGINHSHPNPSTERLKVGPDQTFTTVRNPEPSSSDSHCCSSPARPFPSDVDPTSESSVPTSTGKRKAEEEAGGEGLTKRRRPEEDLGLSYDCVKGLLRDSISTFEALTALGRRWEGAYVQHVGSDLGGEPIRYRGDLGGLFDKTISRPTTPPPPTRSDVAEPPSSSTLTQPSSWDWSQTPRPRASSDSSVQPSPAAPPPSARLFAPGTIFPPCRSSVSGPEGPTRLPDPQTKLPPWTTWKATRPPTPARRRIRHPRKRLSTVGARPSTFAG